MEDDQNNAGSPVGDVPCVLGEPLMHGPEPYRWCATHNRLLLTCERSVSPTSTEYAAGVEAAAKACDVRRLQITKRRQAEERRKDNESQINYFTGKETGIAECAALIRALAPTVAAHRCNGNPTPHHGTQNKCTVCGEYRNGWYDPSGMEMLAPAAVVEPAATSRITVEGIPNRCAKCGDVLTCCLGCKDNEIEDARETTRTAIVKRLRAKSHEWAITGQARNLKVIEAIADLIESTPIDGLFRDERVRECPGCACVFTSETESETGEVSCPADMIAAAWAMGLPDEVQSVLQAGEVRRLQNLINTNTRARVSPVADANVQEIVTARLTYVQNKDLHNGWSGNESGPCCDACAMRPEHFNGRADAFKAVVSCRNPFQLPEVCQCHVATRQAVKNGVIAMLSQLFALLGKGDEK